MDLGPHILGADHHEIETRSEEHVGEIQSVMRRGRSDGSIFHDTQGSVQS
jgi:hypothetical protein